MSGLRQRFPGRPARRGWMAVTWATAGRGGAGVGGASHRSCGGLPSSGVLPACQVTTPGGAEPAAAEGRPGCGDTGRGTGWAVSVTAPAPAVRGRAFSCPWPVRILRNPWVHGRMTDGGVSVSRLAAYMCWSAACYLDRRRAVCKTVGSAYVSPNPTPATPWENGPLAAQTRPGGPFSSCPAVCHGVPL
jgi:hypothetical protein